MVSGEMCRRFYMLVLTCVCISLLLYTPYKRVHGLKSGRVLKEFRGHTSFVNQAHYIPDTNNVISCSSDGTIKVILRHTVTCHVTCFRFP